MSDTWIRTGRYAVVVVGVIVAAISYSHIRDLALNYGGDSLTAPLLPLGIDGAVAAMTVFMHQASGAALWLSRFGLLVAIGMTVAFNTAYGAAWGVTGAIVWSAPAVLLVICIEVSVLTVRRERPGVELAVRAGKARTAGPMPSSRTEGCETPDGRPPIGLAAASPSGDLPVVAEPVTMEPVTVRKTTAKQEAVILGKSQSTIQRWRRDGSIAERLELAMANGNGKH